MGPIFQSATSPSDIPDDPGIYAFNVSIVGPYRFGLRHGEKVDNGNKDTIVEAMHARLTRLRTLFHSSALSGQIYEQSKNGLLQRAFEVVAQEVSPTLEAEELNRLTPAQVFKTVALLSEATLMLPPIYVGMTAEQTLRQRYQQHQTSFTSGSNVFGSRFRALGFRWDDLIFSFLPLSLELSEPSILRLTEKHIHGICPPSLSVR